MTVPEDQGPIDADFVSRGAARITEKDVERVAKNADSIGRKFQRGGPLGRFLDDAGLLLGVIRDYASGRYRVIPWWALAAIAFALLYVLNPIDIVPDALPFIGVLDDAAVVGICLKLVEQQLHEYQQWKTRNQVSKP